ncbi:MBL fold metallo-hydrolase [Patescibacteria group bacterium]|nr:MBL fold metallo-hydrolase [Patescibacteria group bacterium]
MKKNLNFKIINSWIRICGLLLLVFLIIAGYFYFFLTPLESELRVIFLDIGQGDAILIQTKTKNILIDGGPDREIIYKLDQYIAAHQRKIDLMILTHPDGDHLNGLVEVLRRWPVDNFLETGIKGSSPAYLDLQRLISERDLPVYYSVNLKKIVLSPDLEMEILWPLNSGNNLIKEDPNSLSLVLKLSHQDNTFLLTGDADHEVEEKILDIYPCLESLVLKVGHHGSKYSSGLSFLQKVKPTYAVISVGQDNNFGHPSLRVLDNLQQVSAQVLRTDQKGDIIFESNGQNLNLKTAR